MKNTVLLFATIASFVLFSCGGNSEDKTPQSENAAKKEAVKTETSKKSENFYVRDKFLDKLGLTATNDKFSNEDWARISKTVKAYKDFKKTFKNSIPNHEEFENFFKSQNYANYDVGKKDVLAFAELYKIAMGIPTDFGSLGGIKKTYGEEQFVKSCKELGDKYNELNLSVNDLKNIEKKSKVIGGANSMKIMINNSESVSKV